MSRLPKFNVSSGDQALNQASRRALTRLFPIVDLPAVDADDDADADAKIQTGPIIEALYNPQDYLRRINTAPTLRNCTKILFQTPYIGAALKETQAFRFNWKNKAVLLIITGGSAYFAFESSVPYIEYASGGVKYLTGYSIEFLQNTYTAYAPGCAVGANATLNLFFAFVTFKDFIELHRFVRYLKHHDISVNKYLAKYFGVYFTPATAWAAAAAVPFIVLDTKYAFDSAPMYLLLNLPGAIFTIRLIPELFRLARKIHNIANDHAQNKMGYYIPGLMIQYLKDMVNEIRILSGSTSVTRNDLGTYIDYALRDTNERLLIIQNAKMLLENPTIILQGEYHGKFSEFLLNYYKGRNRKLEWEDTKLRGLMRASVQGFIEFLMLYCGLKGYFYNTLDKVEGLAGISWLGILAWLPLALTAVVTTVEHAGSIYDGLENLFYNAPKAIYEKTCKPNRYVALTGAATNVDFDKVATELTVLNGKERKLLPAFKSRSCPRKYGDIALKFGTGVTLAGGLWVSLLSSTPTLDLNNMYNVSGTFNDVGAEITTTIFNGLGIIFLVMALYGLLRNYVWFDEEEREVVNAASDALALAGLFEKPLREDCIEYAPRVIVVDDEEAQNGASITPTPADFN